MIFLIWYMMVKENLWPRPNFEKYVVQETHNGCGM